jgi:hypothetical protein
LLNAPALENEWLESDGLGGFASGTVATFRTRRYHALLLTPLTPPSGRVVLVNGFEAWVETEAGSFPVSAQHYAPDVVYPRGIDFLAKDPSTRSNTSVCLRFVDPAITALTADAQADFSKKLVALVEKEGAGYDFAYYRDAPAGLRIWCGATVEASDVATLTQWIDWAFAETKSSLAEAA